MSKLWEKFKKGEMVILDSDHNNSSEVEVVWQTPNNMFTKVKNKENYQWEVMTARLESKMTEQEHKYFNSIYHRCEFNDECESCDTPEKGSYAVGYMNDESGEEVDYYICGKCATSTITEKLESFNKAMEELNKYLEL
jgi:hypothetical protein